MIRRNATERRSLEESLELCRNAGIMHLDYLPPIKEDDYLETAKRQREVIESKGMTVHQTHSPFFRYQKNGFQEFPKAAVRSVLASAAIGAKFMVIHADEYRPEGTFDQEDVLRHTVEYLTPIMELCQKHGIRLAVENLFEEDLNSGIRSRYTSYPEEVLAVINSFPGTGIGCCLDTGHLNVSCREKDYILNLEKLAPYVVCTHIHDNCGWDLHKPAYFGSIPWEDVVKTLRKAGYTGDWTWEFVYERVPDEVYPAYLNMAKAFGDHLVKQFLDAPTR